MFGKQVLLAVEKRCLHVADERAKEEHVVTDSYFIRVLKVELAF